MARITFIDHTGKQTVIEAEAGFSVMEAAIKNNVAGIDADCGGACSCATCHVYVDEAWRAAAGTSSSMEQAMLDFASDARENSRLSCQIKVTSSLDGLVVRLPEQQG